MEKLQDLMDRLRQKGFRVTRQRAIILQALCEVDDHASAEQIYQQVTLHRRDVDLSTVYRTLETLRNLCIVSQTDLGRGHAEYQIMADEPHHHLVCRTCGQICDLDHTYLEPVARAIQQNYGFAAALDHFSIFGTCQKCRERNPVPD